MNAKDVLAEMVDRYAKMPSYKDTGVVRQWFKPKEEPLEVVFSTSFKKPSLFRFEFASPHPYPPLRHIITKHVVGFDGKDAYSLLHKHGEAAPTLESEEDLSLAVAGATGISGGSAHTIARLLLPEVGGLSMLDLLEPEFRDEATLDGVPCFRIAVRHPRSKRAPEELWVEKATLILRKWVEDEREVPAEQVRDNIRVGEQLDDAIFAIPKQ
jgi:hypothetical protein